MEKTDRVDKKEYRYIGKYVPRKDARQIVTGKCIYLDDYKFKDLLYVRVFGSPYAHAMIKSLDTSEAEKVPGVAAIVTYKNQPEWSKGFLQGTPAVKPLLSQHLRMVGDPVALIAAESEDICRKAMRLIRVEYEHLPAVFDPMKAMEPDAPQIYPESFKENRWPKDLGFGDEMMLGSVERGDVEKEFAEADFIGGGVCGFETRTVPLAPEAPSVVVEYDERTGIYHEWSTSQGCHEPAMPPDVGRMPHDIVIQVKTFHTGGSYGNKQELTAQTEYACMMSRLTHRPVKVSYNKEDQFLLHEFRIGSRMDIEFAMKDGIVTAVKGNWYADCGTVDDASYCITAVGLGEMQLALAKCKA